MSALRDGELEVLGRMPWSSNATLLGTARADGVEVPVVYKPQRGERPLWDFPDGTLCRREVATYELARALGWDLVPETVLRDGPFGVGMVQRFIEHDPEEHYFTLVESDPDVFRQFAVLDILANNADRKGGHCLRARADGHLWGIDHGLTFHRSWKLRTVIWDFAGELVPPVLAERVCTVAESLDGGRLGRDLGELLAPGEIDALGRRARTLVAEGRFPEPDPGYHSVPWPMV